MNDRIERVQVGKHKKVPLKEKSDIWVLLVYENGDWDADTLSGNELVEKCEDEKVKNIFSVWHGKYRTDLFLMDKTDLIKRLKKMRRSDA